MNAALDEGYFNWLYGLVADVDERSPARSHWSLLRQLYSTPFYWSIRNDDNREMDGRELRFEYLDVVSMRDYDFAWMALESSVLEMLIGLARRAAFASALSPSDWFWIFLENLDLKRIVDRAYNGLAEDHIREVINRVINRQYEPDGSGGLFPLKDPHSDQRNTELWYQASAYILENNLIE